VIATGLVLFLTAGLGAGPTLAATSSSLQNRLDGIKEKQLNSADKLNTSKTKLVQVNQKQNTVLAAIVASDRQIKGMQDQIAQKRQEIALNQAASGQLEKEVKVISKRIARRGKLLGSRIRTIYINGGAVSYLDVLMGSNSFGNFLNRLIAVKTITDHDNQIINAQKKDQKAQAEKQKTIQTGLVQTRQDLAGLSRLNQNLTTEKATQKGLLAKLNSQETDLNAQVMSSKEESAVLSAQASVVNRQIADLRTQEEAKKNTVSSGNTATKVKSEPGTSVSVSITRASSSATPPSTVSGSSTSSPSPSSSGSASDSGSSSGAAKTPESGNHFIRPAAGVITSEFGYRSFDHKVHPGIDIANSTGTPIHAAADGVVFLAYPSSSYGNCVMISHRINGRLYTTVYAHMTNYVVSTGQTVSQGQVIGYMGATGDAFGTHLHFELYVGSWTAPPHIGAVNPRNYISF
jgi:Uncharacterized protein conserved in bacteria